MSIKDTVQDTTHEVFEKAERKIGAFADKAYETGKAQAEHVVVEQRNAFKRFAMTIVRALRSGSDELRTEGYATVAGLVDDVAAKAESMTDEIDDLDMRSTTERVEEFVRERPLIAYGAIAIAGFLVANTLQAASQHRAAPNLDRPSPRQQPRAQAATKTAKRAPARPRRQRTTAA